jgi:hypothetical protein
MMTSLSLQSPVIILTKRKILAKETIRNAKKRKPKMAGCVGRKKLHLPALFRTTPPIKNLIPQKYFSLLIPLPLSPPPKPTELPLPFLVSFLLPLTSGAGKAGGSCGSSESTSAD